MVGQEGAVLVQDQDEAEHGEGGEDEEEEVPEQVRCPECGRVKARHDLNLLRACRPLTDWGVFILLVVVVIVVNDDIYVPQGEDEEGGHEYGEAQGESDAKGVGEHVNTVSSNRLKGSCSGLIMITLKMKIHIN